MKNIKITAKYKNWQNAGLEDPPKGGIYKVRELHESNSGLKHVHLWGWDSSIRIDEVELMINGVVVNWI